MTVVVAYSPNEFGQAALDAGIKEAERRRTDLIVVNATKGDTWVDPRFATGDEIARVDKELSHTGLDFEVRQTVGPDVAEQIIDVVEESAASILVIGMRRRSPVGKLLLGSLAQRLLMDCPIPILAVKPGH